MSRDQRIVLAGALAGIAGMLLSMGLLYSLLPVPELATLAERLAYALRWLAFAALPLLLMVAAVGNARFLSEAIDPTRGAEDRKILVNGRVADNTSQQFALFAAGSLGLAASLPADDMAVIAAAAIVFVAARLAFWVGYRIDPLYRAAGFAATAYLNLGLLAAALWLALV